MTLFFFQRKLRVHALRIWKNGAKKGGQGKANFSLKLLVKMKKIDFELEFQTKFGFPWPPFSNFVKYGLSAFSGKKLMS